MNEPARVGGLRKLYAVTDDKKDTKPKNKTAWGSIPLPNKIAALILFLIAIGLIYSGKWGWGLGCIPIGLLAFFLDGESGAAIMKVIGIAVAAAVMGCALGGIAMLFGASFTTWAMALSVVSFIALVFIVGV